MSSENTIVDDLDQTLALYGDKACYVLKSTVKELEACVKRLSRPFENHQEEESRLILHQMLGTSRLLQDANIIVAIKSLQKEIHQNHYDQASFKNLEHAIHSYKWNFHLLFQRVDRALKVVVFGAESQAMVNVAKVVESWDQVELVIWSYDIDELETLVANQLPEFLIMVERPNEHDGFEEIARIKEAFLGTTIVSINSVLPWNSEVQIKRLKAVVLNSLIV